MSPSKRNDIQWLRALAASEVVLWHSDLVAKHFSDFSIQHVFPYDALGGIGVELFFIVSGYVICMRAASYGTGGQFLMSRILRLYPLYILFTAIVIAAFFLNSRWHLGGFEMTWKVVLESLLILPQPGYPILTVGWTLEHEMVFYAAVALTMLLCGRLTRAAHIGLAFALAGLGFAGLVLGTAVSRTFWDYHILSPYMFLFAFGWLVRSAEDSHAGRNWKAAWFAGFAVLFAVGTLFSRTPEALLAMRIAIAAGIFVAFLAFNRVFQTDNAVNRLMSRAGDASYSIYLSHWFILSIIGKALGVVGLPAAADGIVRALAFCLCIFIGLHLFQLVEKPLDQLLRPRRPPARLPAAGVRATA